MADLTQLTGDYAASWLPWIMIPMIFYILPFPIVAIIFLWIEREATANGQDLSVSLGSEGTLTGFQSKSSPSSSNEAGKSTSGQSGETPQDTASP